jgi:hypothetical protein
MEFIFCSVLRLEVSSYLRGAAAGGTKDQTALGIADMVNSL